jgi:solute carrier family 35 protein F1/2
MKASENSPDRSTFSIEEDDEIKEFEIDFDFTEPGSLYDAKRGVKTSCCSFAKCVVFTSSNVTFILGQFLSVALAANGAASEAFHFSYNASVPTMQTFFMYILMVAIHFPYWSGKGSKVDGRNGKGCDCHIAAKTRTRQEQHYFLRMACNCSWKYYALLAWLHVEANFFLLKSYQYVSLKTVSLLDSLAIPAAIVSSKLLLRRKYSCTHITAASICIFGSSLMVAYDYKPTETQIDDIGTGSIVNITTTSEQSTEIQGVLDVESTRNLYPHALLGDAFAVVGALLTGLNDVLAEEIIQESGTSTEYLAMIGFFGTIVSLVQSFVLEFTGIQNLLLCGGFKQWILLLSSSVSGYLFFSGMSSFLLMSESALLNLSLLSGDLWAVAFSIMEEHKMPSHVFYISFCLIVTGVAVYEMGPSPVVVKDGRMTELPESKNLRLASPSACESDDSEHFV